MERQEPSEYEVNARRIADSIRLEVLIAYKGDRCPPWGACANNGCCHGDRYRVTLKLRRPGDAPRLMPAAGHTISFDFWNSLHDSTRGVRPGYYDILACVSSDLSAPTDADEVAEEFGPMKPSQALVIAKHAARLQAFFTDDEVKALGEIQ